MKFVSGFFRLVVGVAFGALASVVLAPGLAAISSAPNSGSIAVLLIVAISAALGFFAPTIRRALGRGFLLVGVCLLALPLGALALSGRVASNMISAADEGSQAATAIGSGIAGMAMTGAATFIGLIAGSIFIIIGLVLALGGRRDVIVIENRAR